MRSTFNIGKILGIPIFINYTWFIIFGLVVFTLARISFPQTVPGLAREAYWFMALISALLLFSSLILHELSHSIVALKSRIPIKDITLFVFGGVAHMEKEPSDPTTEFKMAIAGPATSLAIAGIFFALTRIMESRGGPAPAIAVTSYIYLINAIVAAFNLVPGFPLDGGRVLRAILWKTFGDLKRATLIASRIGKGFAYFLMGIGLLNFFYGMAISGIWFIFIGFFLFEAAETSWQNVAMKSALNGIRVREIMTKGVITVDASDRLDRLVDDHFFKYRLTSFPVIKDDQLLGLLTLHDIKEVPKDKWAQTTAEDSMIKVNNMLLISPHSEVSEALQKMIQNGVGRLMVIEDHKLTGILSQRDVMRLFKVRNDLTQ